MKEVEGSEYKVDVELVLIAAGFLGSEKYVTKHSVLKQTQDQCCNGRRLTQDKC